MGSAKSHQLTRKGKSMAILYVRIDLAKTFRDPRSRRARQASAGAPERATCQMESGQKQGAKWS